MKTNNITQLYAICINNESNPASLQLRKLYPVVPDKDAETHKQIRVIDEDGEDYLYPADCFIVIKLTHQITAALKATFAVAR
ncbi:MAG: hypothetical protein QOC99_1762 [Acidobacteriota bacterium]|jgi:hypothetical protein|nr:hypothetical protein [Acidobacteriota bacterium]MDT7779250.1 hypothetical protein [Acidobacteriota bacterium]